MEEKKESYQKIKYIRGQMAHRSGLKHVIVTENGMELTVDNPEDLDNTIINRNKKHFNQANNTPFATKPITETIGREGNNDETTQVLKGSTIAYFDVQTLYTGTYVLKITNGKYQTTKKVTIARN